MKENYGFLRTARKIFKVLAWVTLTMGVVSGISALSARGGPGIQGAPSVAKWMGAVYLLIGGLYWFICFTISELIRLLLDIRGSSEGGESQKL